MKVVSIHRAEVLAERLARATRVLEKRIFAIYWWAFQQSVLMDNTKSELMMIVGR